MRRVYYRLLFYILIFSFVLSGTTSIAQEKQKTDSTWNNWNFRISPYFWYIGFKGTIYKPPVPTILPIPPPPEYEIDVSFLDIRNSIKFALMLAGQYRSEHIVAQFNLSSLVLESEAITPFDYLLQDNIINLTYVAGDVDVGYRILKNPKFELDGLLGLKFIYFKIGLSTKLLGEVPAEGARDRLWLDPVIGTNLRYRPHRKIEFVGYADFGPAFPDNVITYQVVGSAKYLFTKTFHVSLGYRLYSVKFQKENAIYNGQVKGWLMKVGFQF